MQTGLRGLISPRPKFCHRYSCYRYRKVDSRSKGDKNGGLYVRINGCGMRWMRGLTHSNKYFIIGPTNQ